VSEKRRGLGRGLGALIPTGLDGQRSSDTQRPVDVFFPENRRGAHSETIPAEGIDAEAAAANGGSAVSRETALGVLAGSVSAPVDGVSASTDRVASSNGSSAAASWPSSNGSASSNGVALGNGSASSNGVALGNGSASSNGVALGNGSAPTGTAVLAVAADGDTGDGGLLAVPGARFAELPVDSIKPNPRQPRTIFEEDALDELIGSILEVGVLQPIIVRPDGDSGYELIMGERRLRATQAAGLSTIPAIIRDTEDSDLLRDALLENLHRAQLNPLEEAAAYQQLLDDFGCTHEHLASKIHRSRPQISNTLRLLRLPPLVQRRVAAGVLSAGHARALLGLEDGAAIERLAQRIVAEGLSVRAVEEIVSLGGDPAAPAARRRPRAGDRNEALDELATRLSDRFETRVKINLGKQRGRLTVEFASVQDLNRILESLAPNDPGLLRH
jgi:ParB family chromosome partitioning protein